MITDEKSTLQVCKILLNGTPSDPYGAFVIVSAVPTAVTDTDILCVN